MKATLRERVTGARLPDTVPPASRAVTGDDEIREAVREELLTSNLPTGPGRPV